MAISLRVKHKCQRSLYFENKYKHMNDTGKIIFEINRLTECDLRGSLFRLTSKTEASAIE